MALTQDIDFEQISGHTFRQPFQMIVRDGVQAHRQVAALRVRGWANTYRPIVGDAVADQLLDVAEHGIAMQRDLKAVRNSAVHLAP